MKSISRCALICCALTLVALPSVATPTPPDKTVQRAWTGLWMTTGQNADAPV